MSESKHAFSVTIDGIDHVEFTSFNDADIPEPTSTDGNASRYDFPDITVSMAGDNTDLFEWFEKVTARNTPPARESGARDIDVVSFPSDVRRGCKSKSRRIRKKLAKRYGVFHYRDLDRVSVWRMYNVWPKALRWGYGVDLAAADQVT